MSTGKRVGRYAVEHKRLIATTIVGITLVLVVLATLPSIWPLTFTIINPLKIDTDPENMLPDKEPVRVFHDRMKEIMSLNDMIVVGVVDRTGRSEGVFTPAALEKIYALSQFARGLQWRDPQNPFKREGVVEVDMIAPSMVDNVESGGAGVVRFEWLMPQPPETEAQALEVRRKALNIPFLSGTLVSEDGQAVALYLPLTTKDVSYRIYDVLRKKIADPSQLFPSEIGSLDQVLRRLTAAAGNQADDLLVQRLWPLLSAKTQEKVRQAESEIEKWQRLLDQHDTKEAASIPLDVQKTAVHLYQNRQEALEGLTADLNTWMQGPVEGVWQQPTEPMRARLADESLSLLEALPGKLTDAQQRRLKRLWVEAAFARDIVPSRVATFETEALAYHITGLPVAEDTFGVQMFKQMAISAPIAMVIIFLLMWFFFRSAVVILPAMYDAMIATAATMSLLVITGNTVHIMSSMIPIFIVPIAVLDDVHVISEFFDRYQKNSDRKQILVELMGDLFTPMLYTTLTTAVGFASLALAPIPPVQVFGLFVAFGVIVAWLCSILLVPAFIAALPQKTLDRFGARHASGDTEQLTLLGRLLRATGRGTYRHAKLILGITVAALMVSVYGIGQIRVNDNPTKWFEPEHPIRKADRVLNDHFGGTYMAYLALRPADAPNLPPEQKQSKQGERENPQPPKPDGQTQDGSEPALPGGLKGAGASPPGKTTSADGQRQPAPPAGLGQDGSTRRTADEPELPGGLGGRPQSPSTAETAASTSTGEESPAAQAQIFKTPVTLRWIGALQSYLKEELGDLVGKSNSVTDIVETVHRELLVGVERDGRTITREEAMRVPDTQGAVAQSLLQFQNSHRPQDLWHFVTPDYRSAVVWLQLTSGDNRDMRRVADSVNRWIGFWQADEAQAVAMVRQHPDQYRPVLRSIASYVKASKVDLPDQARAIAQAPAAALKAQMESLAPAQPLQHDWFGLTYINVVWQEKMVKGMLKALLGSFLAVFLMMTLLYRSALWGLLCMVPLTVTIAMIYGLTGLIGKDYDMPVAVLSALSLGLAVDYAIHFLTRSRMMYQDHGSWEKTAGPVFGEPARAISRNAIVVGVGFLPLLLAPLVPYQTVGIFIAAILLLAGLASLLILPAAMTLLEKLLFPRTQRTCTLCYRGTCVIASATALALALVNIQQFFAVGWTVMTWISLPLIVLLGGACLWMSRGEKDRTERFATEEK